MSKKKYLKVTVDTLKFNGKVESHTFDFVSSGCKLFFNMQHIIVEMKAMEISLLLFLTEQMDHDNIILIDNDLKRRFVAFIHKITSGKTDIQSRSVDRYVSHLKKLLLILPADSTKSGLYLVNPKYLHKGKDSDRAELLKETIQNRDKQGLGLAGLIDQTEVDFYYR